MTWQTWAITLTYTITAAAASYFLCELLNLKYKKAFIILAYAAGSAFFYIARACFFIYMPSVPTDIIFFIMIIPVYTYLFTRLICSDTSMKIALFIVLVYALGVLGNLLTPFVYYMIFGAYIAFDFVGNESLYASIIAVFIAVLLYLLFSFIWKRYVHKMHLDIPNIGAFLFVIGGQLIYILNQLLEVLSQRVEVKPWTAVGIIIMIIGDIAILQILLTNSKKAELEENLRELQHIRELEHMHYTAIEARRQEMAKIRHDFNDQLAAARQLIISNKKEYGEKLLDELELSLANSKEYSFCQNAIVNAVLTDKQKECDSAGIHLETEILIDEKCGITPIHLCSIFTNLLDNAIRACKSLPKGGDYLHIKCVNPVESYPEKERNHKGYGKIILSDIANHYNGNFTAEREGDMYVVMMSVLCFI